MLLSFDEILNYLITFPTFSLWVACIKKLAKVLTNRLKMMLVSKHRNTFVQGRQILDS